ncbi:hypothetical protein DFP73DRAFT_561088 [Morchella snyderi]|nr:hypothetical protein DFP73DRAFT_561088 [Morchella snyderi]
MVLANINIGIILLTIARACAPRVTTCFSRTSNGMDHTRQRRLGALVSTRLEQAPSPHQRLFIISGVRTMVIVYDIYSHYAKVFVVQISE